MHIALLMASIFSMFRCNENSPYTFQIHVNSLMSRMTCGFGLYLWCVSFLHTVCLLPLLPRCLARSVPSSLTFCQTSILTFLATLSSTLPLSYLPLNLLFDPPPSPRSSCSIFHLRVLMLSPLPPLQRFFA